MTSQSLQSPSALDQPSWSLSSSFVESQLPVLLPPVPTAMVMSSPVLTLVSAPPFPELIEPPAEVVLALPPPDGAPVTGFAEHAAPVAAITPAIPNKNKALRDMFISIVS